MKIGTSLQMCPDLVLEQSDPVPTPTWRPVPLVERERSALQMRLDLIRGLYREVYRVDAQCQRCYLVPNQEQLDKGAQDDPDDFRVTCAGCGKLYRPMLTYSRDGSRVEMPFQCKAQVLHRLRGLNELTPDEIASREQAALRAAVVHFGSLTNAFEQLGVDYADVERRYIEAKVIPYLGSMSDTTLAEVSGLSVGRIRRLRARLSVPAFRPFADQSIAKRATA